ncbi:MAG: GNAT family N-acetyltransferase [Bacteroidetes bacterium]|nr:GNAT family N-acetyltransferase [Bacteroidota bacterium]
MQTSLKSTRLQLHPLSTGDTAFIFELVNTPDWIKFIGNRNINSLGNALGYIQRILDNPANTYWVVKLNESLESIGVITLIKRDYLEHPDIGFAFLPQFYGKGYAYEAARVVLLQLLNNNSITQLFATTLATNEASIRLLKKLGLFFNKEIRVENESLLLYSATADTLEIEHITETFYSLFTNKYKRQAKLEDLYSLCLKNIEIIKKDGLQEEKFNLGSFVEPRKKLLSDGTIVEFEEKETGSETKITESTAHRHSNYKKSGILNGSSFELMGKKYFQYKKTPYGWKIAAIIWEDEKK